MGHAAVQLDCNRSHEVTQHLLTGGQKATDDRPEPRRVSMQLHPAACFRSRNHITSQCIENCLVELTVCWRVVQLGYETTSDRREPVSRAVQKANLWATHTTCYTLYRREPVSSPPYFSGDTIEADSWS